MNLNIFTPSLSKSLKKIIDSVFTKADQLNAAIQSNKGLRNTLFLLSFCFIFGLIFLLNKKTAINGDDFVYLFIFGTQDKVQNFADVLHSQYIHYYSWGGRSVVHIITQSLLLLTPTVIDIVNSLAFMVFTLAVYFHIKGKNGKSSISVFTGAFLLTWLLQPTFGETVFWITGSSNYLWGTAIILLFLLPYRLYDGSSRSTVKAILYSLTMFVCGILSGWTNENTGAAMLVMIVLFMLYHKSNNWKIPAWAVLGLVGAVIGYILMIIAPGNAARAEGTGISPFLVTYRFLTSTQNFVGYLGGLNLLLGIIMLIYMRSACKNKKQTLSFCLIYIIGVLISIYVMVLSPGFPPRTWFGIITFNIIAFGVIFYNLNYSYYFIRKVKYVLLFWASAFFIFSLYEAYLDIDTIDKIRKGREVLINEKKKEGVKEFTFENHVAKTKFGLSDTPYAEKQISQYYGVEVTYE